MSSTKPTSRATVRAGSSRTTRGPILAVLILGIAFQASDSTYVPPILPNVSDSVELWQLFHEGLPTYIKEIATSLLPIIAMFGVFQLAALKLAS